MQSSFFKLPFWCAAMLTLAGCAVGPNYKLPAVSAPAGFRGATTDVSTNSLADLPWWSVFKDPVLQDLIQVALTNNYDLRITLTRVDQARAIQAQARSQFMPQVGYGAEANRGRNEFLGTPTPNGGQTGNSYVGGFEALWEIDLWGRVRRMNEAARANFMATQEGRRAVMISVVSGVARAYFELLELDEQLVIAQRTRDSYQRTLKLFSDQHAGGLASKLEVSRAELALRTVTATVPEIERQIALKENEINTLLGRNPGPIARTSTLLAQEMPVEIPVGLPSTLLERRPDVRATEHQVRSANAEIGVAIGDFFPRIGLTTIYGGTSTDLDKLLKSEANLWSAAATAAGLVFTGGRLTGRYRQTKGAFEQARLSYQQTALSAFREVSDALISHSRYEDERVEQSQAVGAGREAVELATVRYKEGKASYYEVLEAQQQLFPAENTLSRIEAARRLAVIQLYKALGGGWSLKDSQWFGASAQVQNKSK
ncbi:MAG TPA: efflux transporter outer membrane subunit [Candidatus Acidoferrum sp.]|jgi:multidrug efflux system outer membrane protein|nr:efflux transporter outer membrane subunit [Candidatus Acidoferrum sp.]